ncbi:MAG: hypothetical protein RR756_06145 [Cetobacterium sp.]
MEIHKTLEEHLKEQRALYKQYTAQEDQELIKSFAEKIKREIEKGEIKE